MTGCTVLEHKRYPQKCQSRQSKIVVLNNMNTNAVQILSCLTSLICYQKLKNIVKMPQCVVYFRVQRFVDSSFVS